MPERQTGSAGDPAHRPTSRRRKRLGQHFLHDPRVIARIVDAIHPRPGAPLVEIGPGRGALTEPLLRAGAVLHVVEVDPALAAALQSRLSGLGTLNVHAADALDFDFRALDSHPVQIVGNLPYSISTPLLFHLLGQADGISTMLFMLQKEVVERICAAPGGKSYGRLSVMVQARCHVEELFTVGRGAFAPPPAVDSAVLRLVPREDFRRALRDEPLFAEVVKRGFGQRRKQLQNSLRGLCTDPAALLRQLGIDPRERAERLSLAQFAAIANHLTSQP